MIAPTFDLAEGAIRVLTTADPRAKAEAARAVSAHRPGPANHPAQRPALPDRPARPDRPALLPPGRMPRRRINRGIAGRIALLHALAHIELNAIDLAADILARFAGDPLVTQEFHDDWVAVLDDEARHFMMLQDRLAELGAAYGDLPAHDGLWEAAGNTAHDLLARLAVVPLVLEARGLDVTPAMIERLHQADDSASAGILQVIHDDEIGHVATGRKWFEHVCARQSLDPATTFHDLVRRYFRGALKPPFNDASRSAAGVPSSWYLPLAV